MLRAVALATLLLILLGAGLGSAAKSESPDQPLRQGRDPIASDVSQLSDGEAGTDAPVLIDQYHYTIDEPAPPLRVPYNTHTIAVGPDGIVYALDYRNDRVQYFSAEAEPLGAWGESGAADGRFEAESNSTINVSPGGNIWIQDTARLGRLQIFDRLGQLLERRHAAMPGPIEDIGPDESIFVRQEQAIVRLDNRGRELARWGGRGSGDGQFGLYINVELGPDGSVYVADGGNHRIQRFTVDGRFLGKWGEAGVGPGQFDEYIDLAIGQDGTIYTTDVGREQLGADARIQAFDAKGMFLRQFDWVSGFLGAPTDIEVGPDGTVYALTNVPDHKVLRFNSQGTLLQEWSSREGEADFWGFGMLAPASDGSFFTIGESDVWHVDALGGLVERIALEETDPRFHMIHSVATGADDTLWLLVEREGERGVFHLGADGRELDAWKWASDFTGSSKSVDDIVVGTDGSVYVSEFPTGRIRRFDAHGNLLASWTIAGEPGDQEQPYFPALALAPDGTLVVLEPNMRLPDDAPRPTTVQRFSPDGVLLGQWLLADGLGWSEPPPFALVAYDIAIAPNGVAYISGSSSGFDKSERGVWTFTLDGQRLGLIQGRGEPNHLAVDGNGRLLMSFSGSVDVYGTSPRPDTWHVRYYANPHLVDWPQATAEVDRIAFDWGTGAPTTGLPADDFSARLDRRLMLAPGVYRYHLVADGGARLWLGERLVVDRWHADAVDETVTAIVPAGGLFAQLEYTDPGGSAALQLDWEKAGAVHIVYLPLARTGRAWIEGSRGALSSGRGRQLPPPSALNPPHRMLY